MKPFDFLSALICAFVAAHFVVHGHPEIGAAFAALCVIALIDYAKH